MAGIVLVVGIFAAMVWAVLDAEEPCSQYDHVRDIH